MAGKIYTIDEIREALKDRNLTVLAARTGIHRETLYNLTNKRNKTISLSTYTTLVGYLFGEK